MAGLCFPKSFKKLVTLQILKMEAMFNSSVDLIDLPIIEDKVQVKLHLDLIFYIFWYCERSQISVNVDRQINCENLIVLFPLAGNHHLSKMIYDIEFILWDVDNESKIISRNFERYNYCDFLWWQLIFDHQKLTYSLRKTYIFLLQVLLMDS